MQFPVSIKSQNAIAEHIKGVAFSIAYNFVIRVHRVVAEALIQGNTHVSISVPQAEQEFLEKQLVRFEHDLYLDGYTRQYIDGILIISWVSAKDGECRRSPFTLVIHGNVKVKFYNAFEAYRLAKGIVEKRFTADVITDL
jgi:hypothetical protein